MVRTTFRSAIDRLVAALAAAAFALNCSSPRLYSPLRNRAAMSSNAALSFSLRMGSVTETAQEALPSGWSVTSHVTRDVPSDSTGVAVPGGAPVVTTPSTDAAGPEAASAVDRSAGGCAAPSVPTTGPAATNTIRTARGATSDREDIACPGQFLPSGKPFPLKRHSGL